MKIDQFGISSFEKSWTKLSKEASYSAEELEFKLYPFYTLFVYFYIRTRKNAVRFPVLSLSSWKGSLFWRNPIWRTTLETAETQKRKDRKSDVFAQSWHLYPH